MDEKWEIKIKKLALAYHTGWQYHPGSAEAGSVLTDIFLDMERENRKRFGKIWKKHKQMFLGAVPQACEEEKSLKTALAVRASGKSNGVWLAADTGFYTVPGEGSLLRFRTISPIRLTSAKLCHAVYRDGFCAWDSFAGEEGKALGFFVPGGEELARPEFRWSFPGLCDGREQFSFSVKFAKTTGNLPELKGQWNICCGETVIPAKWQQEEAGIFLHGECAEFVGRLDSPLYELCFMADGEPAKEWLAVLYGGFVLEEGAENFAPEFCLTEEGGCGTKQVLPFGRMLPEAACCYFVCDRLAGRSGQVIVCFAEHYEKEETLPPPVSGEYKKMYKKYPWMQRTEQVLDWQAEECVWEYFNGKFWCILPGSETWQTGCRPGQEGQRKYGFERPEDMKSCLLEGEEHYFIRLRLVRVRNAYAAYHRKYIPVLEDIRFFVKERGIHAKGCCLPEKEWAGEKVMYLGFDREVTLDQCWYTGEREFVFRQGQIKGWGSKFGRKAFWAEIAEGEPEVFPQFCPNYVKVRQVFTEEDGTQGEKIPENIAAGSLFFSETKEAGMLTAVSLQDAYGGAPPEPSGAECRSSGVGLGIPGEIIGLSGKRGKPSGAGNVRTADSRDTADAEGNYFSHYGRLVTQMDLKLFMKEKYPQFCLVSCSFSDEERELTVTVQDNKGAWELLSEFEQWLADTLVKAGGLWFQGVRVRCSLAEI